MPQRSADLNIIHHSRGRVFLRRISMMNYTLFDLLLFSASIIMNSIYYLSMNYIYNSDSMSPDDGGTHYHNLFNRWKIRSDDSKLWGGIYSPNISFSKRAYHIEILRINVGNMSFTQQP